MIKLEKFLVPVFLIIWLFPLRGFSFQLNEKNFKNLNDDHFELKSAIELLGNNLDIDDSKIVLRVFYIGGKGKSWGDMKLSFTESFKTPLVAYPPNSNFVCQKDYNLDGNPHNETYQSSKIKKCPLIPNPKPLVIGKQLNPIITLIRENLKSVYEQIGQNLNKKYKNLWPIPYENSPSNFHIARIEFNEKGPYLVWTVESKMNEKTSSDLISCYYELSWNQSKIAPNPKISCEND